MKTVSFFEINNFSQEELREWIRSNDSECKDTRRWLFENLPKEQAFQEVILGKMKQWAKNGSISPDALIWKECAGIYQTQGLPDISAVIEGQFFGFEVKRPYLGRPTKIQRHRVKQIEAAGGHAAFVSYASEVRDILKTAGVWHGDTL